MEQKLNMSHVVILLTLVTAFFFKSYADNKILTEDKGDLSSTINVKYEFGTDLSPTGYKNIYVIWIENTQSTFIQVIKVCKSLLTENLTGTALPYWKVNKYPMSPRSEIDAVTSATQKNCDFSVTAMLKDNSIRQFSVYCEIDRSYEPNDWFTDQPAVLYSADINLDDTTTTYRLRPVGWTPNEETENIIPNTSMGFLQSEMMYITNRKSGNTFRDTDPRSLTSIVKNITLTLQQIRTLKANTVINDNLDISLDLNQTTKQISIVCKEFVDDIFISDLQGKVIFQSRPKSKTTLIKLNKNTIPKGLYFAKITTRKGVSSHKILIKD